MYCPVWGCNSDSKNNPKNKIHFFAFPPSSNASEKSRRKIWKDFCKRKKFEPGRNSRICSPHFKQEDYVPSHSPAFLASLGFRSKINYLLKEDAVPTENKPLGDCSSCPSMKKPRSAGRLSQIKVIFSEQFQRSVLNMFE